MQILRVGRGYSADWTVQLRDDTLPTGLPVLDVYDANVPLALVICDSAGMPLVLTDSTVEWLDPLDGTITLHIDDADTTGMAAGVYGLSIRLSDGGEPLEAFRAVLRIEPRVA